MTSTSLKPDFTPAATTLCHLLCHTARDSILATATPGSSRAVDPFCPSPPLYNNCECGLSIMKVVALVSGGKDSCYAMYLAGQHGHEVVAAANLLPSEQDPDELDSFMYQTVRASPLLLLITIGHACAPSPEACSHFLLLPTRWGTSWWGRFRSAWASLYTGSSLAGRAASR